MVERTFNCIWFTPIYASPQVDNGYDVSDYYSIEPDYGTLEDFKQVLDTAHSLGIKVMIQNLIHAPIPSKQEAWKGLPSGHRCHPNPSPESFCSRSHRKQLFATIFSPLFSAPFAIISQL